MPTLLAYVEELAKPAKQSTPMNEQRKRKVQSLTLLAQASPDALAMTIPEHEVLVLSEIVGNFRELLQVISSKEGRQKLEGLVDAVIVERLVEFWREEYIVE